MSQTTVKVQLQQRIDTSSNWTSAGTTVLLSGEIGWESDTKKYKIGDGSTQWSSLAYAPGAGGYTAGNGISISASNVITASAIALSTIQTAANETAMLALTTQEGDVVVRSDQSKTYMKNNGTAGSMADFTELATPTDAVTSVNGNTGAITADQLAAAIESATDSNTFTDADHTKLNSLSTTTEGTAILSTGESGGTKFLREDGDGSCSWQSATVDISGKADLSGATFTGDVVFTGDAANVTWDKSDDQLEFADNARAVFGADSDFRLYHNGTSSKSIIYHTHASGVLSIAADHLNLADYGNEHPFITCDRDGSVEIYFDNNPKLTTVTGGVTVTGTISAGSASFTDDGSSGPVINISGDDSGVWYGRIGNETYHDNVGTGFKFYVQDDGDALFTHYGNAEYRDWSIGSHDGTTSQYDIYRTAAGAVYLYNSGNVRLTTTAAGISVTGSVTDSTGELRTIVQNTQAGAYTLVAADAGKHILASGNITVPDSIFTAGQAITIVNNTGGDLTITKGTNMYNIADASNANRTLGTRGVCTLLFTAADTCYISGSPLS